MLIELKNKKGTITYSEYFSRLFDIPYNKKFLHFIKERGVINNIPYMLGDIGKVCKEKELPPLSCLVVRKNTGNSGYLVETSIKVPVEQRPDFAKEIDLPAVKEKTMAAIAVVAVLAMIIVIGVLSSIADSGSSNSSSWWKEVVNGNTKIYTNSDIRGAI
ncbi:MAG: hypothetical protein LBG72_04960 [Spirochaetaceae bacterium]|jgi:hypothetical protein|nr:hypothetical protein [Spirochaetaceae bacterium]